MCKSIDYIYFSYAALHKIYSPIEIDPHLDFNEKDAKMIEWYEKGAEVNII